MGKLRKGLRKPYEFDVADKERIMRKAETEGRLLVRGRGSTEKQRKKHERNKPDEQGSFRSFGTIE